MAGACRSTHSLHASQVTDLFGSYSTDDQLLCAYLKRMILDSSPEVLLGLLAPSTSRPPPSHLPLIFRELGKVCPAIVRCSLSSLID